MNPPIPNMERENSLDQPRPETWAASPIDLYGNDAIRKRQLQVGIVLQERAHAGAEALGLPRELATYLFVNIWQRFHHEAQLNQCSYADRLIEKPEDFPVEFIGSYHRSMTGDASPDDLLIVRRMLGMASVEVAKLSHVGGEMIDDLFTMRSAVEAAIRSNGGYVYHEDTPTLNLISGDSLMLGNEEYPSLSAMTMTRKRRIGLLPDGTEVREKSQFILCIDEGSRFDGVIAEKIRKIKIEDGETWRGRVLETAGFSEAVLAALEADDFRTAIPLSTTIYAYNEQTAANIKQVQAEKKRGGRALSNEMGELAANVVFMRETDGAATVRSDEAQLPPAE